MKFEYDHNQPQWLNYVKALSVTGEIDPTYYAFKGVRKELGDDMVKKLLTGMMMFYDMGVACLLAETPDAKYWEKVDEIYPTCKRGAGRRHYRGENGKKSIADIKRHGTPVDFWNAMSDSTYMGIKRKFDDVSGFGDYFIWKFADFSDRVFEANIDMLGAEKFLPKEPRNGARIIAKEMNLPDPENFEATIKYCLEETTKAGIMASPGFERPLGLLEIETCYCGYKHQTEGDDWVGKDILNHHTSLASIEGDIAKVLAKHLPAKLPRDYFPDLNGKGRQTETVKPTKTTVDLFSW